MTSDAVTVAEYLEGLTEDRREILSVLRATFLENLPEGYEERMQYGAIGYCVPFSSYPAGYHCDPKQPLPFAGIASQKNHVGIYLFCIYGDPVRKAKFAEKWKAKVKKLDMGAACIRIKKLDDVPLDVLGDLLASLPVSTYVEHYQSMLPASKKR